MKKTKTLEPVRRLRQFAKDGGKISELAFFLDYKSSETVRSWIKSKRIPHWVLPRVEKFLEGKGYVNEIK